MFNKIFVKGISEAPLPENINFCFNFYDKHLVFIFGDWQTKNVLLYAISLLRETICGLKHSQPPLPISNNILEFQYSLSLPELGQISYYLTYDEFGQLSEVLIMPLNKRRTTILSNCKGQIFLHKGLITDSNVQKFIEVELLKNKNISILQAFMLVNCSYSWSKSPLEQKLFDFINFVDALNIPSFEELLLTRDLSNSALSIFPVFMKQPRDFGVSVVSYLEALLEPMFLCQAIDYIKGLSFSGQLILFSNSLELLELSSIRGNILIADAHGVQRLCDFDKRTFKNNNVRSRYLAGDYIPKPNPLKV